MVLTHCDGIDILLEVTGTVEPAARVVSDAFDHGKNVVLVNAELDSLLGPILKVKADKAGVVVTHTDGDEPGVAMTLLRYLRTLGLRTVAAGNIKGMVDYYRTPETQKAFRGKTRPGCEEGHFLRGFDEAFDGSDGPGECDRVSCRAPWHVRAACGYVREIANRLPAEQMLETGLVDYASGGGSSHRRFRDCSRRLTSKEGAAGVLQTGGRAVLRFLHAVPSSAPANRIDNWASNGSS